MRRAIYAGVCLAATISIGASCMQRIEIPAELNAFGESNTDPVELESADLDGDGRKDFLLVLETRPEGEVLICERRLLIILRRPDNSLAIGKRSDRAIGNSACGGLLGDCFQGIVAKTSGFTITEYGGSSWRWRYEKTFRYSRRDRTWQLVRVVEEIFNVNDAGKVARHVYQPPRDYGKIRIEDFEADRFLTRRE